MPKTVGIIGIEGKYGSWFKSFFQSKGYTVIGTDKDTASENGALVERSDVVLFATPLGDMPTHIAEVVPYGRPNQLWVEIGAVKRHVMHAMKRTNAEILGLHPLCQPPSQGTLKGENLVAVRERTADWNGWIDEFLKDTEACVVELTADAHDQAMMIQVLSHELYCVFAAVLERMRFDRDGSMQLSTPVFRHALEGASRVLAKDPRLIMEIQRLNPYAAEARVFFRDMAQRFSGLVNCDEEVFSRAFLQWRAVVG